MRVSLFLRGDCDQIQWFLCWPDKIHLTAWFLKKKRYRAQFWISCGVSVTLGMSTVDPCYKRLLDMHLISWLDSESTAGSCGLCHSSAPGPAAIARRKSTSPLTWNTVESGFQSFSQHGCTFPNIYFLPPYHETFLMCSEYANITDIMIKTIWRAAVEGLTLHGMLIAFFSSLSTSFNFSSMSFASLIFTRPETNMNIWNHRINCEKIF